jgi:hypothetical protein
MIWNQLLADEALLWTEAKRNSQSGRRILLATSMGVYDHAIMLESALAVTLTLRDASVDILLCDEFLPCCQMSKMPGIQPEALLAQEHTPRCKKCYKNGKEFFSQLGLPIHWYSQLVGSDMRWKAAKISEEVPFDEIAEYKYEGLALGEHAFAGALRFYARGDLNGEPLGEKILRRYLKASLLTAFAVQELLQLNHYDIAVFHHGIYVPQGVIGEVCRKNGLRIVNWNPSYRKHTFIFSLGDSYHHTMISEPVSEWENIEWTEEKEKGTMAYLKSRWHGTEDWIWFHEKPEENIDAIQRELGIDFGKPSIGMLTNVMWDAQLHYKSNAFSNMTDWVFQTIDYFGRHPELQLIIRVHPAEVRGMVPSRQKLVDEINKAFPELPENVFIIAPECEISTYAVMEKCNAVIIYNTKTGIEISSLGIPVIVAGEAWIRGKGISVDASSPDEYFSILGTLPFEKLSDEKRQRAKKYAYHFFFRRMLEIPFIISPEKYKFTLDLKGIRDLLPGRYPDLDVICEGILNGRSFVSDEESFTMS